MGKIPSSHCCTSGVLQAVCCSDLIRINCGNNIFAFSRAKGGGVQGTLATSN